MIQALSSHGKVSSVQKRRLPIGRVTALDRIKIDRQPDDNFYAKPNLNVHADKIFREKLTSLYNDLIPEGSIVLDMMSSHVSHLPPHKRLGRVDVHGMNAEELRANPARNETGGNYFVRNLNDNPSFVGICDTGEYDIVLCCVGVQYLEEAEAVFAEVGRILKPGSGLAIVSFTNRFFYQKALTGWIERGMKERSRLVSDYFRAAGGFDSNIDIVGDGTSPISQLLSIGGVGGDPYVAVVAKRNLDP
eukprot:CAMPEP_0178896742 /NCGR_PEP_ID=MMETSP0786-20121207/1353_1 /TAXON_ID=186022 /ORGANISM="Thalassionema frauenfeldii, Strain CCMP 1798" /LENGTH=246 /DNA_ID=CAMNT_0020567201 /DNA_START=91 /DNA_END=831 /DNA_ORIENTATION=+